MVFVTAITPTIKLGSPIFTNNVNSAADSFSMDFSINRDIFKYDKIILNMGSLNANNGNTICQITTEEGKISTKWSSCDTTALTALTLKPIEDIPTGAKFTLKLPHIVNM
jgi:hypothetical protein